MVSLRDLACVCVCGGALGSYEQMLTSEPSSQVVIEGMQSGNNTNYIISSLGFF